MHHKRTYSQSSRQAEYNNMINDEQVVNRKTRTKNRHVFNCRYFLRQLIMKVLDVISYLTAGMQNFSPFTKCSRAFIVVNSVSFL
jgi:hypothetical protein